MCRFGTNCPIVTMCKQTRTQAVLSVSRNSDSGGTQLVPTREKSSCAEVGRGDRAPEMTART